MLSQQINESVAEISVRRFGNYYPDPDPELTE